MTKIIIARLCVGLVDASKVLFSHSSSSSEKSPVAFYWSFFLLLASRIQLACFGGG